MLANSSSDEEEESDGEWTISDRWEPVPPSPRAEGAAVELAPGAGAEPPAVRLSEDATAGGTKAPAEGPPIL
jgi:hypothetical protein